MLYLIDENVLITAKNQYYKFEQVPEYWEWLLYIANKGMIKMPQECYDNMQKYAKQDELARWLRNNFDSIIYKTGVSKAALERVRDEGYGLDLSETDLSKIGADCYLIAHALSSDHTVVTSEVSKPKQTRSNSHIPDVCEKLGVKCLTPYEMNDELEFSTSWNRKNIVKVF